MMSVILPISDIVIDYNTRKWCKLPYPNHPRGCPNFNKRDICPPLAPLFPDIMEAPLTLVGVRFDLEAWSIKMKKKHPNWSDRQSRCCLYWQGKVRKILKKICHRIMKPGEVVLYNPEANGINIFKTCRKVGIELERNPRKYVWKIAIIGREKIVG